MKHTLFLASALLAASSALPAKAQVVLDLSQITCGEYLNASLDDQAFISSWLSGYFHAATNKTTLDLRAVKRNHAAIAKQCGANKRETLMTAVKKAI